MKRLKVVVMVFVCLAAMAVALAVEVLAWLVYWLVGALLKVLEAMKALADSMDWLACDLCNTARGWMRWAVR